MQFQGDVRRLRSCWFFYKSLPCSRVVQRNSDASIIRISSLVPESKSLVPDRRWSDPSPRLMGASVIGKREGPK